MKEKASLKDIAKVVGVSIPLVSYVLSNKGKENRVSEITAKKIREVAKELNYQPNLNARSLKTNKTRTLGMIVADISNPFFANLARIVEDEAYSKDYTVIFGSSDENEEKFEKVMSFLQARQVDGFILAAPDQSRPLLVSLKESNTPFVLIDRYFRDFDANYVIVDNFNASQQATNFLLSKGNKRIASIMYDSSLDHYKDRCNGFLEAMKSAGIEDNNVFVKRVKHTSLKSDMKKVIKKLIDEENVDAIYFQTNTLAEEGLRRLKDISSSLLKKIDVVVFDQNSSYHFLENFIPYVKQPIKEMGQKAVELLIGNIESDNSMQSHIMLKTKLEVKNMDDITV